MKHLQLVRISKSFGDTRAVANADLDIRAGQVLALLGENGAGKSTLMKLLYGIHTPDSGQIHIDGKVTQITSPRVAMDHGFGMVFQQSSLIPALTVRENLALALESSAWWIGRRARVLRTIDEQLLALAPSVAAEAVVAQLSVGQLQLIELAKVRMRQAGCIILDEPSSVLTPAEAQRLWLLIRQLVSDGVAVVLITHKIADVRACADRVAVMRAGRVVMQTQAAQATDADIVGWMVGQTPPPVGRPERPPADAPVRLLIKGMSAGPAHQVDLGLRRGEILGVAGISGSGQTALAEAIAGARSLDAGEVILDGELLAAPRRLRRPSPELGYIPSEPLRNATAPTLSLAINLALKGLRKLPLWIDLGVLARQAQTLLDRFAVRPAIPSLAAGALSGGNLQKLVAARELSKNPAVVVACYPTMGLDVTAAAQVYDTLFALAAEGTSVLWVSEDLDDLLQYAHQIAVMFEGRVVQVVDARQTTAFELGGWMTGQTMLPPAAESTAAWQAHA